MPKASCASLGTWSGCGDPVGCGAVLDCVDVVVDVVDVLVAGVAGLLWLVELLIAVLALSKGAADDATSGRTPRRLSPIATHAR